LAREPSSAVRRQSDLAPGGVARLSGWLRGYKPLADTPDELIDATGRPRDNWLALLGDFAEYSEADFKTRFGLATRHIRDTGVSYRVYGEENERSWPLNPLPLLLSEQDWSQIAAGVEQRANLMEALLGDIYGEARLVADGSLPAAVLTGSPDFLRSVRGMKPPGGRHLQLYAADLGRGPDGRWWVLDDRAQAPSGAGYALENRLVLSRAYPNVYNAMNVQRLAPFFEELRKGLAASAGRQDPRICLLTPGPFSETYFEQAHLARYLGFLLVEGADLTVRDGRVYIRTVAGLKRVDVILRRVDGDYIDPLELNSGSRLGAPGLLEAIRAGGVSMLNIPGSGVLESKALLGFLPRLCRRLLGEELKLPNVATWWCGQTREREIVERNLDRLAVSSAFTAQGDDRTFAKARLVSDFTPEERADFLQRLADRPGDYVGQEVVRLSTTPTLRDDRLAPAPFVLRVYAVATPDGMKVMPGGFCRTSARPDARAISMSEDAGTSDVWVIANKPVERVTLLASRDDVRVRRIAGLLPSRAADNLFWLGRYLERAEATLRLVRSLCTSLMDSDSAAHTVGETLTGLQGLLIRWGALDEEALGERALETAIDALHNVEAYGSVTYLVRSARRAAASLRERLSADFWSLLLRLEQKLTEAVQDPLSEAAALAQVESALQTLAALAGLAQENMNRGAGWRFLDMGRRVERGVNICAFAETFAHDEATMDDLDLLLDLADSQITYRARYLVGLAPRPVLDMVLLDNFNTRSLAFQVATLVEHVSALPALVEDGMPEAPKRTLLNLSALVETETAADLTAETIEAWKQTLMQLSEEIGERYFLQGGAAPGAKMATLA
jgi:uncharacterized circularly permuted ATP-grasp superfamily protein/uncharacterized alpha-E superfamily protein